MNDDHIERLLGQAIKPMAQGELKRDLWPEMRQMIDERSIRVSRFDWALIAAVVVWLALSPSVTLALLYHL